MPQHAPTDQSVMIAKRILKTMLAFCENPANLNNPVSMSAFTAMGFILAIVFEECTGISAKHKKPTEIMHWATDLPTPSRAKVPENMII